MRICPNQSRRIIRKLVAGREGAEADTLSLYGAEDIRFRRTQIDESPAPAERRHADHGRLNALLGLAEALECRRSVLLGYFGEQAQSCGKCDLCEKPPETFDGTTACSMNFLRCCARMNGLAQAT